MAEEVKVKDNEIVKVPSAEEKAANEAKMSMAIADMPINMRTLQTLMATPTVPKRYRESETGAQDMMAAIITGRELGVAPMAAIRQLYLINGQASMMAQLMAGLVFRAGHRISYLVNQKDEFVVATAYRRNPNDGEYEDMGSWVFGKDDAELAGLDEKGTYQSYPYLMYAARATSALCRLYFPEVIAGVGYVPDEIGIDTEPEAIHPAADITVDDEAVAVLEEVLDAEVIDDGTVMDEDLTVVID